jgi:hypothetical protein
MANGLFLQEDEFRDKVKDSIVPTGYYHKNQWTNKDKKDKK